MKIRSLLVFTLFIISLSVNLFPQQNNISDEERRARIVEAYNRQMQVKDNTIKGGEDPLPNAMTERFFTGQAAGDGFGISVSSAGDVNGDGYSDVIVGAVFYSGETGRAYIYFGGPSMDYMADVIMTGEAAFNVFGYSVSSAGDVNGDGYGDVIVGAFSFSTETGRAYIYFGGPSMDNMADVIMTGESTDNNFGCSVSTAGDVNGDGYSDVIVGANSYSSFTGRAYIYFGGPSMNNVADVIMTGESTGNHFGISVSTAGDINGDGYSDVIVGAIGYSSFTGRAYIYFGGPSMNNVADVIMTGEAANNYFGKSVSTAGDVNGDGYSDIIVGADYYNSITGRTYIYFGGPAMDNVADVIMTGESTGNHFGISVSTAGDINGDGYSDVIVGADGYNTNTGRAYIYFGGPSMDNIADAKMTGESGANYFGHSVSTSSDVNGDGYSEVIVGSYGYSTNTGRAYLYLNSLTGPDIPDEFFTGENPDDQLGYSVSNAGDVNGDGFDDIIVGAPAYDDVTYTNNGIAYIYYGGPGFDNVPDVTLFGDIGNFNGNNFGYSVSAAGDVNGDGFDDVIVGAPFADFTGTNSGTAYIFFGSSYTTLISMFIDGPDGAGSNFGSSVSCAGDVNSDGYSDVIVGAPLYSSNAGRAYIYYGGSSINTVADVVISGSFVGYKLGNSVSTAEDINGDGYSDVIIGAYGGGSDYTGWAYIYFGGSSMDNLADVTLTGAAVTDQFGFSVSTAGDVNGDGYSDVIVGAVGNDVGGTDAGRTYIYYGGISMNNVADVIMTGAATGNEFGYSVSTAGDINGDGYSDVIAGAAGYNSYTGRAYIYFGGTSMNNVADVIMTGEAVFDNFGNSVSTAGDVNGDGYSDLIVGAAGYSSVTGRAYIYLSSSPPIIPRIISVKDVPFDQGGKVKLKWVRSGYDVQGISTITDYLIQRSFPPDENGFAWENISTMPASNEPFYSYVAETPNDSMTNNSGTYYFRITARTANPNEYWRSNIMFGHSTDNLAPLPPGAFYAQLNGSDVHLGWQANLEPDFRDYYIYRSDTPVLDDFTLLATTTDTNFVDSTPLTGNAYYYVQAYDIHDNGSELSGDSIMAFLSANIKVLLEGSYDAGGVMRTTLNLQDFIPLIQPYNTTPWNYTGTETVTTVPANVTDWVLVELRSTTTTVVDRRAAFIKNDGTLVDLDGVSNIKFPTATAGDYYVVMIHRNHLPVMTANKITISFSPLFYDMRTDTSAYGTNALKDLGGGYFGAYTADTDGSGTVNAADRSNTWNQRNLSGYYGTDVDLRGTVNAADRSSVWNNRNLSTQVPAPITGPATKILIGERK